MIEHGHYHVRVILRDGLEPYCFDQNDVSKDEIVTRIKKEHGLYTRDDWFIPWHSIICLQFTWLEGHV